MTKILVTGATGNVGQQVAKGLRARGAAVRAGVRDPARAADLAAKGAEPVRFDFEDDATLEAAFDHVERAFLMIPFVPDFAQLAQRAVEAAKRAGVRHLVKLSASGADPDTDFWLARNHGQSDRAIAQSGLGYTILRPTFFQDNLITYAGDTIRNRGTFYGAAGDQKTSWVSTGDIAAVAVEALLHPESHAGRTYDLTGSEALSNAEVAEVLSRVSGRPITYSDLTLEQFAENARAQGTPELYVEAFVGLEAAKAKGYAAAVSPHVEQVLNRKPERLADFLARKGGRKLF